MKKWLAGFFLFAALLFALPRAAEAQTIPAPVFKSASVKTSSHVTLSWKRVPVAAGYRVYASVNGGRFRKIATVKRLTYTTKSLRPAIYTFKVRAVVKRGSKVLLGKVSKRVTRTVKRVSYSKDGHQPRSTIVKLAKKIGGMHKVSSKKYRSFAAVGNGVAIGYNASASYPDDYLIIKNTGNRALALCGVRLGMTRGQALRAATMRSYDNGDSFGVFYAGVKVKYDRNGKISAMLYRLSPTS